MESGGFQSVEDVLMQALKSAPPTALPNEAVTHTGAELVAAMRPLRIEKSPSNPSADPSRFMALRFDGVASRY